MYRANVKKTNEPAIQYEFALFMVQAARESTSEVEHQDMLREAKQILQKLADRSYPFAQYYLGDGLASGVFNKGKEDYDRAFPLFIAASKHGHAESGYRAALCYEFGWGCRRDYAKAVQFYRASASRNHPGAATRLGLACLEGTMGLNGKYREGVKWLKRAAESADPQHNSAPYELARLHEIGYGDDIFKDEAYAAQLYTQSAELGHPEANLVMGKAYEYGLLTCPKDAALSIHFYNSAAQAGQVEAMMALCAWYLFGAEPILTRDDQEAFEWAKKAADLGKQFTLDDCCDVETKLFLRICQSRVRCRLLQRNWYWLPAGYSRSQCLVRPSRSTGRRPSEAAAGHHQERRVGR
jgi:TPR repeat protein